MTPERHEQIVRLYQQALDLAPDQRIAFLETACAGDQTLRQEVESLLALDERAKDFIETPAMMVAADLLVEEPALLPVGCTVGFYRILSTLGAGGMGEVYLAEDSRLGRRIALKLLPVRFTQDGDRLRWFEQEARAASALNHPNIITIHDIGRVEDCHFIATEFIDGQTLRQKITNRPLKLEEAIEIAIQAGNALEAAHAAGVVHRDIKPENIMLRRDGYVKVLDFGLAKLTQASEPNTDALASVATTGLVMGTVRYMSPEQARGEIVDARSDIFSLGVVLYEMLAGKSPFTGETTADMIAAIVGHEPPLSHDIPEAPDTLKEIVTRSLRKDRYERYKTAHEMVADLKVLKQRLETESGTARKASSAEYLIGAVKRNKWGALLTVTMSAVLIVASIRYFPGSYGAIDSIAVLPFINESKDPNTEYLSGISDSIINRLQRIPNLRVLSLSATLPYKEKPLDVQAIARDLNVRAVLIGWLTQRGDDLSVRVELWDARDNRLLSSKRFNLRGLAQLFQLQDDIVREISGQLRLQLTGEQQKLLVKHETENPEAYDLYLKGRFEWNKVTDESLHKSIEYFLKAVGKDENYALAYSGLADAHSLLGEISAVRPHEAFTNARVYAETALRIDDKLAEAWVSLGIVRMYYEWDWTGAEKALGRARELNPSNPDLYHFYGHYLQIIGRKNEAISETKKGLDLARRELLLNAELGWAYYCDRQYDLAVEQELKTLALDRNFSYASWVMALAYEQQQKYKEALDELNKARDPSSDWSWILADIGYVYAKQGEKTKALRIIAELEQRATRKHKPEYIDPVIIAYIYIALDNKDEAFRWLDNALKEKSGLLPWLKVEPKFDGLREDPRFVQLMEKIGLPQE